ncbi:MAG: terminase family protein [Synergistaceae bacterium]|jgi:phage FluMu gp28-like protein|nr:terminase family protein [Synergistaceae bacterium]
MAYNEKTKKEAKRLYSSGWSCNEIAEKLDVNPDTVFAWRNRYKWDDETTDDSIEGVKKQIAAISATEGPLSEAQARKLDKLTKAVERLERFSRSTRAEKKGKKRGKGDAPAGLDVAVIGDIRDRALEKLYAYQRAFLLDEGRFRICLKSRQTGFSFLLGLEVLLGAVARNENQIVVSASQDQSDIVRNYAVKWCADLGVDYLEDDGNIIFPGGKTAYFLPCNPRTVQGYTGDVYLDEFAWHMRSRLMWQAVVPAITVGKKRLTVTSTPYTETDMFGEIVTNPEKYPRFSRHTVTIHDAIRDGHPVDIGELRDLFDAMTFAQAYECRFFADETCLLQPDEVRAVFDDNCLGFASGWVNGGVDIGRVRDLTAIILAEQAQVEAEKLVFVRHMETLAKMAFDGQKTHLAGLVEGWKIRRLAMDSTGIGMQLAEDMQKMYPGKVERVHFTREKKEAMALSLKKLFETRRIRIPNDRDLVMQLHAIKRKPTEKGFTYDADRNEQIRHADLFWALALAVKDFGGRRRVLTADNIKILT